MDLQIVERKVKNATYTAPEDFEYDVLLIFQNCIAYNMGRSVDHLVSLGKYGIKQFKRIFSAKLKALDDPSTVSPPRDTGRKSPPPATADYAPAKKLKMESGASKVAPRISLSSSQLSSTIERSIQRPKPSKPKAKSNQPVPLHIAISQVKENFPLRRAAKSLQSWEAGCARFFKGKCSACWNSVKDFQFLIKAGCKELMRHTWISAARPKYIFHVPVPVLFPVSTRVSLDLLHVAFLVLT